MDLIIAALLDLGLGDPYGLFHPVQAMGALIKLEESGIRHISQTHRGLRLGGLAMALFNIALVFSLSVFLLRLLPETASRILGIYMMYSSLSAKMLAFEAKKVKEALEEGLEAGRRRLQYIVGRDTAALSQEEVIKATVETVAENTSDGVIAPLFYILLLGPAGGWTYKMVNTMDSMIGYKNDKYLHLGRYPALIDDIFNYIPARLTGLFMCLSALGKYPAKRGWQTMLRDRKNHLSPNAGYPEAAVAGLLGIELGGGHYYFGKYIFKPTLGQEDQAIGPGHIEATINIMYRTAFLFLVQVLVIRYLL
ncbi:MAG: adenosylcobinamide-phosphate synthase CbiB [Tissierellia bacterium]|nr:adenosylcobinamide-phosphate synthase CbiB [Tissierellia bacterium]